MRIHLAGWGRQVRRFPSLRNDPPPYTLRTVSDLIIRMPREYKGNRVTLPSLRTENEIAALVKREILDIHVPGQSLIIDSGAYGFLNHAGMVLGPGMDSGDRYTPKRAAIQNAFSTWMVDAGNLDKYHSLYINVVLPLVEDIADAWAEFDLGSIVGTEKLAEWREEMRKAGYADRCILACHDISRKGAEAFLSLAKDWPSQYIAVPELAGGDQLGRFVDDALDAGLLTHGFGISSPDLWRQVPFATVDTNRWSSGIKWGRFDKWIPEEKRFEVVPISETSQRWNLWWKKHGVSPMEYLGLPLAHDNDRKRVILKAQIREFELAEADVTSEWKEAGVQFE